VLIAGDGITRLQRQMRMSDDNYGVINPQFLAEHTSNDLLFTLHPASSRKPLNYEIVAQGADEVQHVRNAPPCSIGSTVPGQRTASRHAKRG
jgi:hypothetical protein